MQAKSKNTIKKTVDVVMTLLLLCLMAYQVTGEALHEWFGIGMTVLLIVHHILNIKWYSSLFKGKYNVYRIVSTLVNIALLASVALTAVCGMSMSSHAAPFLYGLLPVSFARRFHLATSFWSFILMGVHLGLHVPAMTSAWKWNGKVKASAAALFALVAGIGLRLFLNAKIPDYIFFRTPFAFLDYDKASVLVFAENLAILISFAFLGALCATLIKIPRSKDAERRNRAVLCLVLVLTAVVAFLSYTLFTAEKVEDAPSRGAPDKQTEQTLSAETERETPVSDVPETEERDGQTDPKEIDDGFVLINGGTFLMGSPVTENWRIDDETPHEVTLTSFYIDRYETTQKEYSRITGRDPSFFKGEDLPVESVSWLDAVVFANAKSVDAGLTPVYTVNGDSVVWDRSANGYRLPTEAEWEYACRAGTVGPFNADRSLDADDANFYGHYPYEIEENYFNDSVLEARPGLYRQKTVEVGSFYASAWGLYDMHGNVNEWCWDHYGDYGTSPAADPSGPETGTRHVYRGGGWNDFGKNMRSAYRAAGQTDHSAANLGIRLVRNAGEGIAATSVSSETSLPVKTGGKTLIAFYSWGGNTRGIAREIQKQTGADLFEIKLVRPYSTDYNTVLMQAQEAQHRQDRPEIADLPDDLDEYDVILLGYPNWWASIPMPIATFLESCDFTGKTVVPFCSHGGGRFGQSLTAIAKLAPDAEMGTGLSVHYSGGSTLASDVSAWLEQNNIRKQ